MWPILGILANWATYLRSQLEFCFQKIWRFWLWLDLSPVKPSLETYLRQKSSISISSNGHIPPDRSTNALSFPGIISCFELPWRGDMPSCLRSWITFLLRWAWQQIRNKVEKEPGWKYATKWAGLGWFPMRLFRNLLILCSSPLEVSLRQSRKDQYLEKYQSYKTLT